MPLLKHLIAELETLVADHEDVRLSADMVTFLLVARNRYGEAGLSVPLTFTPALGEFRET